MKVFTNNNHVIHADNANTKFTVGISVGVIVVVIIVLLAILVVIVSIVMVKCKRIPTTEALQCK